MTHSSLSHTLTLTLTLSRYLSLSIFPILVISTSISVSDRSCSCSFFLFLPLLPFALWTSSIPKIGESHFLRLFQAEHSQLVSTFPATSPSDHLFPLSTFAIMIPGSLNRRSRWSPNHQIDSVWPLSMIIGLVICDLLELARKFCKIVIMLVCSFAEYEAYWGGEHGAHPLHSFRHCREGRGIYCCVLLCTIKELWPFWKSMSRPMSAITSHNHLWFSTIHHINVRILSHILFSNNKVVCW